MLNPDDILVKSIEVKRAMKISLPIVALESTVLTHGLPRPQNLQLAYDMERAVREQGATPATVGFLDGYLHVGLTEGELDRLANEKEAYKVGPRDFATVISERACGGTTVAGTMFACKQVDIKVFATGGIGGVHRETSFDISADLQALANIPMVVVCAGAKAILDLPATLEYLETLSVPVIGYQTDKFPAFYSRDSGLDVGLKLNTPLEIAEFAQAHWSMGMQSAILVTNPIPGRDAIQKSDMDPWIQQASAEAQEEGKHGKELTPFLLDRIRTLSNGKSVQANISLLLNNARLAGQIAKAIRSLQRRKTTT
ncbi:MAG TPA: pseudouridine-5'-phosphate glycosidase [Anaerolineales bacterium]|nr:pseudouridine-5'-phosphate glycosidase [Anaerolineales bacterium]